MPAPVPAWAADAVRASHRGRWHVGVTAPGGATADLPVTAGRVVIDGEAWPRSTCQVSVGDLSLAPSDAASVLLPFGSRLTLRYRLDDLSGQVAEFTATPPLLIDTVSVARGDDVRIDVEASDDALAIDTDAVPYPVSVPPYDVPIGERTIAQAIAALIRRTFPAAQVVGTLGDGVPVGADYRMDGSPWATIEDLADRVAAHVYQEPSGRWVIAPEPVPAAPAAHLMTGPGGTVTATTTTLTRAYNRVALTYTDRDAGTQVTGWWTDTGPGPTAAARMGRVTLAESRDGTATQVQANAAATAYARRMAGRARSVTVDAVCCPWVLPGDTCRIALPTGAVSDLIVARVEHDLTGAASRYTFRADTVAAA